MGIAEATRKAVYSRRAARRKTRAARVRDWPPKATRFRLMGIRPRGAKPTAMFTMRGIKLYDDGRSARRGAALLQRTGDDPETAA